MELVAFRPVMVRTIYDPTAYHRESFPTETQGLESVEDSIQGELRQSTPGVVPGDWKSYQDETVEATGLHSLTTVGEAINAQWDLCSRRVTVTATLANIRGVKADIRRFLCAGDTARRFEAFWWWPQGIFHIPSYLLTDLTCLGKSGDALYVESAFRDLFGASNTFPVLGGDGVYVSGASNVALEMRHIVRAE